MDLRISLLFIVGLEHFDCVSATTPGKTSWTHLTYFQEVIKDYDTTEGSTGAVFHQVAALFEVLLLQVADLNVRIGHDLIEKMLFLDPETTEPWDWSLKRIVVDMERLVNFGTDLQEFGSLYGSSGLLGTSVSSIRSRAYVMDPHLFRTYANQFGMQMHLPFRAGGMPLLFAANENLGDIATFESLLNRQMKMLDGEEFEFFTIATKLAFAKNCSGDWVRYVNMNISALVRPTEFGPEISELKSRCLV